VRRLVDLYEADPSLTWENTLKIEGTQADLEDVLRCEPPSEPSRREDIHEIINYWNVLRLSEKPLQDRPFISLCEGKGVF
jgi:hypothetical protein